MKLIKDRRIDYNMLFHLQKDSIKVLENQLKDEKDLFIRKSVLLIIEEKYKEMLDFIEFGASYDKTLIQKEIKKIEEEIKRCEQ